MIVCGNNERRGGSFLSTTLVACFEAGRRVEMTSVSSIHREICAACCGFSEKNDAFFISRSCLRQELAAVPVEENAFHLFVSGCCCPSRRPALKLTDQLFPVDMRFPGEFPTLLCPLKEKSLVSVRPFIRMDIFLSILRLCCVRMRKELWSSTERRRFRRTNLPFNAFSMP